MDMQALKFDLVSTSFLNHLTIERGLSVHTIAAYRRDLVKFESFLNGRALGDVDPQTISDFEVLLKTAQASPASINASFFFQIRHERVRHRQPNF